MTTTDAAAQFDVAERFLDTLASGEFAQLSSVFENDVTLRALLPGGFREWQGVDEVCDRFKVWFGDVEAYEVVEAEHSLVGPRLQLRWQIRLAGERFEGARLVEQIAFVDTGAGGRIAAMSLLCSGYTQEHADA